MRSLAQPKNVCLQRGALLPYSLSAWGVWWGGIHLLEFFPCFIQLNHTQPKHIFVWNNETSGELVYRFPASKFFLTINPVFYLYPMVTLSTSPTDATFTNTPRAQPHHTTSTTSPLVLKTSSFTWVRTATYKWISFLLLLFMSTQTPEEGFLKSTSYYVFPSLKTVSFYSK